MPMASALGAVVPPAAPGAPHLPWATMRSIPRVWGLAPITNQRALSPSPGSESDHTIRNSRWAKTQSRPLRAGPHASLHAALQCLLSRRLRRIERGSGGLLRGG
jgi:hypothetical protein